MYLNQNPNFQSPPPIYVINQTRENCGFAVAALVFGIIGFLGLDLCGAFIFTIIFGHIALSKIKHSNGALGGRGMAIAGLILGYIPVLFIVIFMLFILVTGGIAEYSVREKIKEGHVIAEKQKIRDEQLRDEVERKRIAEIEERRIDVSPSVLKTYEGTYEFSNGDKHYDIVIKASGNNLETVSEETKCTAVPTQKDEFTFLRCENGFQGRLRFEPNKMYLINRGGQYFLCPPKR